MELMDSSIDNISRQIELLLEGEYLSKYRSGIYSSVTLDGGGIQKLWDYLNKVGLPMQHINNVHCTVIYSRSRPTSEPIPFDINGYVRPKKFGIFGKGSRSEPYVLVLEVDSPELTRAHNKLIKDLGIKASYREYKPHITLVLDINRLFPGLKHMTEHKKKTITNIFDKMIPELPKQIRIQKHSIEPLK